MKAINALSIFLIGTGVLTSCDHRVTTNTIVHEGGRLDKTIILTSGDKSTQEKNYFGINAQKGWHVSIDTIKKETKQDSSNKNEYRFTFRKSFSSAETANQELAAPNDSLFRVTSKFEKQFRWFYTTCSYSEKYHQLNRFNLSIRDYLTDVDFQFIKKLPAEGKGISKADSLFLIKLNERIFDGYVNRAYFEEFFETLLETAAQEKRQNLEKKKEEIFQFFTSDKNENGLFTENDKSNSFDILSPQMANSLGINRNSQQYRSSLNSLESKTNFMKWAKEGKYENSVELAGEIVEHNADSVNGNTFFWQPPYLKFAFEDYTMYTKTRTPNIWAWVVTVLILAVTAWGLLRRKN